MNLPLRACSATVVSAWAICGMLIWSTSRTTGTTSPRSVSTATPMLHVLLVDDLVVFHVDRSVDQRMQLERLGDGLHHEGHHRQLDVGADVIGQAPLANPLQLGDVGVVEIRDVRNRRCRAGHVDRDRLANGRASACGESAPQVSRSSMPSGSGACRGGGRERCARGDARGPRL